MISQPICFTHRSFVHASEGFFRYAVCTFSLNTSQMPPSFAHAARFCVCRISDGISWCDFSLSLHDGMPCIVNRIAFVVRTVVGDALDHYLGIVAAGEGALRVGQSCSDWLLWWLGIVRSRCR